MIKRRFFERDHGSDSSGSSSSSDSDSDADSIPEVDERVAEEESEEEDRGEGEQGEDEDDDESEDEEAAANKRAKSERDRKKRKRRSKHSSSPGSGYESEDSSVNEVKVDSAGLVASEEESSERGGQNIKDSQFNSKADAKKTDKDTPKITDKALGDPDQADLDDCILKCRSVFKCRLCPRIVCLNEDTVKVHLNSKRHARSKKLLSEGRLKLMLNSDGEVEEDLETHAERHLRTIALAQAPVAASKRDTGRQRQQRRKQKQLRNKKGKTEEPTKKSKKKQRRNEV